MRPRTAINDNVFDFQALLHPATVFEHRRTWYRSESAPEIAVCILPGSELAFASNVKYQSQWPWPQVIESRVGKFSVLDPQVPQRHDEAIEYLARRNSLHRSRLMRKTGEPHVMAMARLGRVDVPRIAARRSDDCERERRADVRVSRMVGDPRITLLIVDQYQGPPTGDMLFKGDDAAAEPVLHSEKSK